MSYGVATLSAVFSSFVKNPSLSRCAILRELRFVKMLAIFSIVTVLAVNLSLVHAHTGTSFTNFDAT